MKIAQFIISLILFVILYFPLFPQLIKEWLINEDYSHGFFIPFLSAYFLWRKRDELNNIQILFSPIGILFIIIGVIVYLFLAGLGYLFTLQYFSMLLVLVGIIYVHAGKETIKKIAFPLFYLVFMIPMPELIHRTIAFRLGLLSTKLAFVVIKLLGIHATMAGNIINLPTATLIVATPCSGIRSLITYMAASLAIGYLFQKDLKKRIMLFSISPLLAVLMNTIRLTVTAYATNMLKLKEISMSTHDIAGIAVIILGFIILFFINDFMVKRK